MIIHSDMHLYNFTFWSGALYRTSLIKFSEWEVIEEYLEELYPLGIDEVELNDIFWFNFDEIAQILGYKNENDFIASRDKN